MVYRRKQFCIWQYAIAINGDPESRKGGRP
jgi:hypothetical protein